MQNGSSRKSNIARKTSMGIARRTLILAAVAALGITTAGKSALATTEQVQDFTGTSGGQWGTGTNWSGGAPNTVPNNAGSTVYVVDTSAGTSDATVDLHGGTFTIAGILGTANDLATIENTTGSGTLIIDPNTLPLPAASLLDSAVTNTGTSLTLQFGQNSNSNNPPGTPTITSTINGLISGNVNLIANGPDGDLILNAFNTYSGVTTIENGATLTMSGAATIGAVALSGGSTFSVNNPSISITDLTSTSASDSIVLGSGDRLTATLTGNDTVDGVISGSGYFTLSGSHTLTLVNNNTYTGGTTINAGATLNVASTGSIEGAVTVYGGGTFDVNNSFGITDLSGGGNIVLGSGDILTVSPTTTDTFSGVISGTGALTIGGTTFTSLTLSGAETYAGATTIDAGATLDVTGTLYTGFTYPKIPAMVTDNGTFEVNNSFTIGDLNGEGFLSIGSDDTLTINNQGGGTFAGSLDGGAGATLAVTGHHHSTEMLTGDLTNFTGSISLSHDGMLDISSAQNNPDIQYEYGNTVYFYVDFTNAIKFGSGDGTLITGQGALTPSQITAFNNAGYTNQYSYGEELSGPITLTGTHHATIDADGGYTLISGSISNTDASSRLTLENGNFYLSNDSNSSDFTAGSLKIDNTQVAFDSIEQLPGSDPGVYVPIDLDGGTLQPNDGAGLVDEGGAIANPLELSYHGGTLDAGDSDGYYYYYYEADPVVFSGVISPTYTGSPGTLAIINSDTEDYYYYGVIALTGVNTYSTATTIGSAEGEGGYMLALAGNNSAFGSGSLTLDYTGSVGTTNDIVAGDSVGTGAYGATPIHITVSSFNSTASDEYADLAVTGQATNISGSPGNYTVTLSSSTSLNATTDNTNDAIVATGTGGATLAGPELYLETDPLESGSGAHSFERPYDFSQYVVVEASNNTGTGISGEFSYAETDSDAFVEQELVTPNGAGGPQYLVATVLTDFAEFANNSNEGRVGNYLDNAEFSYYYSGGTTMSPAMVSTLVTLSEGSYAQIAQVLKEISPVDYASLGDQAIQNSTYESQQIFGQIDSAFSNGGFNTGGLALLKTSGSAPDPFSTALQASLNTSTQMAQNVASLSSVNFMDDTSGNGAGSPPVPEQETPESQLSGFVSGDIVMSTLPEGNYLGQPHYTTGGVTAGIDYRLNENWVVGGYFNYGYTGATLDYLGSRQQSSSYSPGMFVGYENGPWYLDALGSYTYNDYRIDRNFSVPGAGTATGKPTSNQFDLASLGGFYVPVARNVQIGPAGGFAYTYVNTSSFGETGSPLDLNVSSHTVDSLRSLLGGQAKFTCPNSTMPLDVNFNAFWQHEFLNGAGGLSAGLSNVTGPATFLFTTTGPTRDSALVGGGLSGELTKNITVFANYESQIGDKDVFGQSIIAGLSVSFK